MALDPFDRVQRRLNRYLRRFEVRYLEASGLVSWRPLVPAKEFTATVAQSVNRLLLREESRDLGAYVEFGVSRGTSFACVYRELRARKIDHVQLVGFDSFEGLPTASAAEGWVPGAYHSTLAATRRYLSSRGVKLENVELVKGWFEETLTPATKERLGLTKVSLIMFDCDTYSATKLALEYTLPLIQEQAVVIFDDWGGRADRNMLGQREAFQEVIADRGVFSAEPCPAYGPGARVFLLTRLRPRACAPARPRPTLGAGATEDAMRPAARIEQGPKDAPEEGTRVGDSSSSAGRRFIFVGGAPRSGTTLVQNMLDCHPEILGAPEFLNLERIVELRNRLRQGIDRGAIEAFASAPEVDRLTAQLIEDLLLPLADRHGAPYLSEKTPSNALVFRELLEIFPAARCIFVLRDPRAIIASMLEVGARAAAQGHPTQPWTRSLPAAVAYVQRYFRAARAAAAEAPGRVLVLRYETLVTEPEAVTRAICGFLGLPWTAAMLTPPTAGIPASRRSSAPRSGTTRPRSGATPIRPGSTGGRSA